MNKLTIYALALASTVSAISCGRHNENESMADTVTFDSSALKEAEILESMMDSVEAEEPADTLPKQEARRFPNTESQLNYMKQSGHWEQYQSGILPTMAEEVPNYCERILQSPYDNFIIVDKGKMKLFLYDKYGNIVHSCGIACGKNYGTKKGSWDSKTVEGIFNAVGVYDSHTWPFTDQYGNKSGPGVFGPWFIRVQGSIGIHGTSSPGSIGKRISHGCIRVTNDNIIKIKGYAKAGMPIIVSPGPKDMAANKSAGINIPSVTTETGTARAVPGNYSEPEITSEKKTKLESEEKKEENIDQNSHEPDIENGIKEEVIPITPEIPETPTSNQAFEEV